MISLTTYLGLMQSDTDLHLPYTYLTVHLTSICSISIVEFVKIIVSQYCSLSSVCFANIVLMFMSFLELLVAFFPFSYPNISSQ